MPGLFSTNMKKRSTLTIEVDNEGRLFFPTDISERLGFKAGAKIRIEEDDTGIWLSRSSMNLARIYIEPSNQCNLDCITCMRNVWDEAPGRMSDVVFERILEGIRSFHPTPTVIFGGYGEPLTHPDICEMVYQAHLTGAVVELITNGILLNPIMAERLVEAKLDRLWVSLDGATPDSYADVRLGAALPKVIGNLQSLKEQRSLSNRFAPRLGIAFVAMKRNIHELPDLISLGKSLGADEFCISNVLPHTPELRDEMLYQKAFNDPDQPQSERSPLIAFPRLKISEETGHYLVQVLSQRHHLSIARHEVSTGKNTCPFVEKGSLSIRWDGKVSPCLALLHTHDSYLDNHVRKTFAYDVGSTQDHSLVELWNDATYTALRERLLQFDFSPCITCNSCEMAEHNREDCFGNILPSCGGCLWGQGYIQCP